MTADEAAEVTPGVELVDARRHIDSDRLDAPVEAIVEEARRRGVTALVMAGVDPDGWRAQAALALGPRPHGSRGKGHGIP